MSNPTVAETILKQLGGSSRLIAMTGAFHLMDHGNALSFKYKMCKKSNYVKITLEEDLYTVEFSKLRGLECTPGDRFPMIGVENLRQVFTAQTGLDLHL